MGVDQVDYDNFCFKLSVFDLIVIWDCIKIIDQKKNIFEFCIIVIRGIDYVLGVGFDTGVIF